RCTPLRSARTARGESTSTSAARAQEFDERPDRHARRPLGNEAEVRFGIRGARDVEVNPGILFRKLAQERGGGDGPSRTAARVLDVGDVGLDEVGVVVPERQLPSTLAGTIR